MIQPRPVMSTHGTPRTLSAPRSPKPTKSMQKRKGKIEKEHLSEALDVSIAMHENAKEAEARENVDMVEKQILAEDVEKLVEGDGDDESFVDSLLVSQEDPDTRLETESHKECPMEPVNVIDNDKDDNDQHNVESLTKKKQKGSQEIRDVKKQTTILTTPRSPRTNLTSDKEPIVELTDTDEQMTDIASSSK
ncbi:hypothetical protein Tco_0323086 [Tanacetum coccineum]